MKKTMEVQGPVEEIVDDASFDTAAYEGGSEVMVPQVPLRLGVMVSDTEQPVQLKLPTLKIAHGVGKLSETFNPGDWVLADTNLLAKKGEAIEVVILGTRSYWKEYTEFVPGGPQPRQFFTKKEVLEAGGTTEWTDGVGPTFNRAMEIMMLVRKPKDLICALFGVDVGAHTYAPAQWYVDKSAYRTVAPTLESAAAFSLRKRGLESGVFKLTTKSVKAKSGNLVVVPSIELGSHLTDAELTQLHDNFGMKGE